MASLVDTERGDTARAYTERRIDMAWTAPKVDWTVPDGVGYADLNEIGENLVYIKESHMDLDTGIHGAVSAATASKLLIRDAAGRAKVVAPAAESDIALKSNVTAEAGLRVAADAVLQGLIDDIVDPATGYVPLAGATMAGQLIGDVPDADYTTAQFRNIKLLTSVPGAGDLENGEIAMVYEV